MTWRATLLANGVFVSATAKAYRLLRFGDDRDRRPDYPAQPLPDTGARDEKPGERPVLTVAQVFELAGLMKDRRFRAPILLATFASLRWGDA